MPDLRNLADFYASKWKGFKASGGQKDKSVFFRFGEEMDALLSRFSGGHRGWNGWTRPQTAHRYIPTTQVKGPLVQPSRSTHQYGGTTLETKLMRVWNNDSILERKDHLTLLDLPWIDSEVNDFGLRHIDPYFLEEIYASGWGGVLETDIFKSFHVYRKNMARFKLFDQELRAFFLSDLTACTGNQEDALQGVGSANKRVLFTTENGLLASSPRPVWHGDLICIIQGASFPVILRSAKTILWLLENVM